MVDIVHSELGKRPNMWSPLEWKVESPPRRLVTSQAIVNLWTGDLSALAYNMTKSGTNQVVTSVGWCKSATSNSPLLGKLIIAFPSNGND